MDIPAAPGMNLTWNIQRLALTQNATRRSLLPGAGPAAAAAASCAACRVDRGAGKVACLRLACCNFQCVCVCVYYCVVESTLCHRASG